MSEWVSNPANLPLDPLLTFPWCDEDDYNTLAAYLDALKAAGWTVARLEVAHWRPHPAGPVISDGAPPPYYVITEQAP